MSCAAGLESAARLRYISAMAGAWPHLKERFGLLDVAAYATIAAVGYGVWLATRTMPAVAGWPARPVAMALVATFTAGMLACSGRPHLGPDAWTPRAGLAVMLASALALLWLGPIATAPVLLIILASAVTFSFAPAPAAAIVATVNLAFLAILVWRWHAQTPLMLLLIYGGFQAFAAFTTRAVQRADATADELRAANADLLATRSLLAESARDGERLRLSRELHDVAGHKLTALKLNLASLAQQHQPAGRGELDTAAGLAQELLDDIRRVVSQLRRHEGLDLREALTRLAEQVPQPRVHVEVADNARAADAEQAAALLRTAQEGLTNALRHARADNVWLRLRRVDGALELVVEDDGRGAAGAVEGHGLTGMRERLAGLGGELSFGAGGRGGWRLCARLPLPQRA